MFGPVSVSLCSFCISALMRESSSDACTHFVRGATWNMNWPNHRLAAKQPSATHHSPSNPISFRWPPIQYTGRRTQQTDRKRECWHTQDQVDSWEKKPKQQTQEPVECEQLFLARSRHGNSSSLQSRAYLGAVRASEKTWQQLWPLLFTIHFWREDCLGPCVMCYTCNDGQNNNNITLNKIFKTLQSQTESISQITD